MRFSSWSEHLYMQMKAGNYQVFLIKNKNHICSFSVRNLSTSSPSFLLKQGHKNEDPWKPEAAPSWQAPAAPCQAAKSWEDSCQHSSTATPHFCMWGGGYQTNPRSHHLQEGLTANVMAQDQSSYVMRSQAKRLNAHNRWSDIYCSVPILALKETLLGLVELSMYLTSRSKIKIATRGSLDYLLPLNIISS